MLNPLADTDNAPGSGQPPVCSDYLLVCQAESTTLTDGRWQFAIETADGTTVLDAADEEPGDLNRLSLLAAVRGLEAIDGPASVTLLSNNRYLIRSLSESLPRWRKNGFVWEHFGRRVEVQHADLWRRIDRALAIHRVEACLVSSRLVSGGAGPVEASRPPAAAAQPSPSRSGPASWRVDAPHTGPAGPRGASGRPADRLRRWLLGGSAAAAVPPARRRFTAADLFESS